MKKFKLFRYKLYRYALLVALFVPSACGHLPVGSKFVCNESAEELDYTTRPSAVLESLSKGIDYKEESRLADERCDQEFIAWYMDQLAKSPQRLTDYDKKRFVELMENRKKAE